MAVVQLARSPGDELQDSVFPARLPPVILRSPSRKPLRIYFIRVEADEVTDVLIFSG